jgi:tetratricopeptide (TPR) repeat protein
MIYAKKGDFEQSLEWYKKRAEIEKDDPEALYTIGVLCWDKVYNGGLTLELDRRRELIDMGLDYLGRANELREDYFEATSYVNLLYREKAKLAQILGNNDEFVKFTQEADNNMKLALEMRKRAMANQ